MARLALFACAVLVSAQASHEVAEQRSLAFLQLHVEPTTKRVSMHSGNERDRNISCSFHDRVRHSRAILMFFAKTKDYNYKRDKGVYCAKDWDAFKARGNNAGIEKCKAQCEKDATCIGFSVTNEVWHTVHDNDWCNLCKSTKTKHHQNLDTYWKETTMRKLEDKEKALENRLEEVEKIEKDLCLAPELVSAEQFEEVKSKPQTEKELKAVRKDIEEQGKIAGRQLEEKEKQLQQEIAELERIEHKISRTPSSATEYEKEQVKGKDEKVEELQEVTAQKEELEKAAEADQLDDLKAEADSLEKELEDIAEIRKLQRRNPDEVTPRQELKLKSQKSVEKELEEVEKKIQDIQQKQDADFWNSWLGA